MTLSSAQPSGWEDRYIKMQPKCNERVSEEKLCILCEWDDDGVESKITATERRLSTLATRLRPYDVFASSSWTINVGNLWNIMTLHCSAQRSGDLRSVEKFFYLKKCRVFAAFFPFLRSCKSQQLSVFSASHYSMTIKCLVVCFGVLTRFFVLSLVLEASATRGRRGWVATSNSQMSTYKL